MGKPADQIAPQTDLSGVRVWYPETERRELSNDGSASFLDYCLSKKVAATLARRDDFQMEKLRPWLGNVMVLEFLPDREDFRYRLYGSRIAERTGFDMTGKCVSDFRSAIGDFFRGQYLKAIGDGILIASRNPYLHSRAPCDWERVICPVQDRGRQVIVATNYTVELSGRIVIDQPDRSIARS